MVLLIFAGFILPEENISVQDIIIGALAGVCVATGLVSLYTGLAHDKMGVVAPVTAVVAAIVPVIFSIFLEGLPQPLQIIGFGIALISIWLISRTDQNSKFQLGGLKLPIFAGIGFGLFFILIERVSDNAIWWPLVSARITSICLVLVAAVLTQKLNAPNAYQLPIIALAGIFDTGGNVFYALATRFGRLDIAAILSSLYPAVTVILAWIILKERLTLYQWFGVVMVLLSVILITI
jgi:drug/metabolite transporter (DMT)-like permease